MAHFTERSREMVYRVTCLLVILLFQPVFNLRAQGPSLDVTARLMKEFTEAYGPSGSEGPVGKLVMKYLSPLVSEVRVDGLGSIIGTRKGSNEGPRIMLAAHMDEVGFLVKTITPDGFIYMNPVGGWRDQVLLAQRWVVMTRKGPVVAVSGSKTPHVMSPDERERGMPARDVFLDVGARSREEAAEIMGIQPGDPIAPDSPFQIMANGDYYMAKAWDDRMGLVLMIEVLKRLQTQEHPNTILAVATVQEEIGLRGAHTSTAIAEPDLGISLEVGVAADYPGIDTKQAQESLGKGPGIFLLDSSMIPNRRLRDFIADVAHRHHIPFQYEVLSGYGEDGAEIQRFKSGRPSINLTVPTRYLHSHIGILSRKDFDKAVDLLVAVLMVLDQKAVEQIRSFDYGQ
jgi:putative aminopeptidase FrvX